MFCFGPVPTGVDSPKSTHRNRQEANETEMKLDEILIHGSFIFLVLTILIQTKMPKENITIFFKKKLAKI